MDKDGIAALRGRLEALRAELAALGPLMRGSVVVIGTKGKHPYFSLNKDKRTKLIYLGKKREAAARACSANYQRLLDIVEEMTLVNMELLKNDSLDAGAPSNMSENF